MPNEAPTIILTEHDIQTMPSWEAFDPNGPTPAPSDRSRFYRLNAEGYRNERWPDFNLPPGWNRIGVLSYFRRRFAHLLKDPAEPSAK